MHSVPSTWGSNSRDGGWLWLHGDGVRKAHRQSSAGQGGWLLGGHHHRRGAKGGKPFHQGGRCVHRLCAQSNWIQHKYDQPFMCWRSGGGKGLLCKWNYLSVYISLQLLLRLVWTEAAPCLVSTPLATISWQASCLGAAGVVKELLPGAANNIFF